MEWKKFLKSEFLINYIRKIINIHLSRKTLKSKENTGIPISRIVLKIISSMFAKELEQLHFGGFMTDFFLRNGLLTPASTTAHEATRPTSVYKGMLGLECLQISWANSPAKLHPKKKSWVPYF